ncbi:MAG: sigma-70 family RNA polymerase sigma factor [bacterium]|nr:sigma-70 family RNA polymerase sigma factor [bacterium]
MMTGSLQQYTADGYASPPPVCLAPSDEPPSDIDLITLAADGDVEAFADLYNRHSSLLLALALRVLGNRQDAEETLQETFLYAWKKAKAYDGRRSSVLTWLVLITRSRSLDRLRSLQSDGRMREEYGREETAFWHSPRGVSNVLDRERSHRVASALRDLPEAQRHVLELSYFEGLTQREVAEHTGIPLGTVKTRTLLAMKKLRKELGDEVRQLM